VIDYWSGDTGSLLHSLETGASGLEPAEAKRRLAEYGLNELTESKSTGPLRALWSQVKSPVVLLLILAAFASMYSGELVDATIVLVIVSVSIWIGYTRELNASRSIAKLRQRIRTRVRVVRDGTECEVPSNEIVPGDIVLLSAGSIVPADGRILESVDFFVNEAVLTGESFPVEKKAGAAAASASVAARQNCVFLGTNVRSGTARCVIVNTGPHTQFGSIAHRLTLRAPETEFDRGIRRFGYLLASTMFVIVIAVSGANLLLHRPAMETLLFAIALAVGLSPELLPAILTVNLARGAQLMAKRGVLVRELNAIENLGSMDILCTDKTGTLTEGIVRLAGVFDPDGMPSPEVSTLAGYNSALQTGLVNPLDEAVLAALKPDISKVKKLGEIPYDFMRKRLSVIIENAHGALLVTKGAFEAVLRDCSTMGNGIPLDDSKKDLIRKQFFDLSAGGTRVLAVATRQFAQMTGFSRESEQDLTFRGFLTFLDLPKAGVNEALSDLKNLGVSVKLITGDSRLVAQHVARLVGMNAESMLTGEELAELNNDALLHAAERTDLFVEVDPNQKERIILALKKTNHVVGFLGDGVNDAPAMHAADTGISVDDATDVAREAADFVLLERDLDVIRAGIEEGRRTFANTLKYILTTTSANLGNMVSMAAASLYLPFLPLLASQILLNNFLSDIPAIGLADDNVDKELVAHPRRWNMSFIRQFMIQFGLISSVFDFLTFALLLGLFHAGPELFRTGWFVESLLTEIVIALVVRTRRPFFRSKPGTVLLWSSVAIGVVTPCIPFLPFADVFGFVPLTFEISLLLFGITATYVLTVELAKPRLFRRLDPLVR